ncbi:MAG: DNA-3-methyladenine glycosylase [Bacteroidetes bacterium]|nr:DNA-3-methyladenine glycosylase [Bacteroidota bacterium]
MKLGQDFYARSSVTTIARELLGKYIYTNFGGLLTAGMITETEAYEGVIDRASHAYNNRRTNRTEVMYADGGTAYVYLCYGIHHLFNIVTNVKDIPHAVLLRGIKPVEGIKTMESRVGRIFKGAGFSDGPGRAAKALGIKVIHSGMSLTGDVIWIEDKGITVLPDQILTGPRIGIPYANEHALWPYRFLLSNRAE